MPSRRSTTNARQRRTRGLKNQPQRHAQACTVVKARGARQRQTQTEAPYAMPREEHGGSARTKVTPGKAPNRQQSEDGRTKTRAKCETRAARAGKSHAGSAWLRNGGRCAKGNARRHALCHANNAAHGGGIRRAINALIPQRWCVGRARGSREGRTHAASGQHMVADVAHQSRRGTTSRRCRGPRIRGRAQEVQRRGSQAANGTNPTNTATYQHEPVRRSSSRLTNWQCGSWSRRSSRHAVAACFMCPRRAALRAKAAKA